MLHMHKPTWEVDFYRIISSVGFPLRKETKIWGWRNKNYTQDTSSNCQVVNQLFLERVEWGVNRSFQTAKGVQRNDHQWPNNTPMYLSQHKNNLEVTAVGKGKSRLCVRLSGNNGGETLKSMASAIMFALTETHCAYICQTQMPVTQVQSKMHPTCKSLGKYFNSALIIPMVLQSPQHLEVSWRYQSWVVAGGRSH